MGAHPLVSEYMTPAPISRIMIQSPITVTADSALLEAAETMYGTKYGALPVVSDGRLAGILTGNDLAHALVDVLRTAKPAEPA